METEVRRVVALELDTSTPQPVNPSIYRVVRKTMDEKPRSPCSNPANLGHDSVQTLVSGLGSSRTGRDVVIRGSS
jgi:hypothetical protein